MDSNKAKERSQILQDNWWVNRLPEAEVDFLVHVLAERHIIYVTNPKVASSTLKATLWRWHTQNPDSHDEISQLHRKDESPFKSPSDFGFRKFMVNINSSKYVRMCFVRNPYMRVLSCYLDKIKGTKDEPRRMRGKLNLPVEGTVSFSEFVERIASRSWYEADRHWRAQTENLLWDDIHYDFVGKFEFLLVEIDRLAGECGIDLRDYLHSRQHHAKNAALYLDDYYTQGLQARVHDVYKRDFEAFGYAYELPGTERLEHADAMARQAVVRFPDQAWGHVQRAEIAMRREDWETACERWAEIRRGFPDQSAGFQRGGEALLRAGHNEEAEAVASETIMRFPDRAWGYVHRGEVAMRRRDWSTACSHWTEVRRRFPEGSAGFVRGAAALLRMGKLEEADAVAKEAVERFPETAGGHVQRAEIAMRREEWGTACSRWAEVRRRFPEHDGSFVRGAAALLRAGHLEEAETIAGQAVARFPDKAGGHVQWGEIAMCRGDWKAACERWAEVRRRFPERAVGFVRGQTALVQAGRLQEAAAVSGEAAVRFPGPSGNAC